MDITVSQNHSAEAAAAKRFSTLQSTILQRYGMTAPSAPVLRLRNTTQTSIVLEWDPISLATSTLRSLALYRNGQKAGAIPRPLDMLSTKISGLAINTEYSFYLVLRTSGGTFTSNTITARTHEMTNLTGITVTPGVLPPQLRDSLERACERIQCRIAENVRIDTTHFVCTEPRGGEWQKAVDMNIPVVRPEWIEGCEREGKITGVRAYYLDADPKDRVVATNPNITQQQRQTAPVRTSSQGQAQPQTSKELPVRPQGNAEVESTPAMAAETQKRVEDRPQRPAAEGDSQISEEEEDDNDDNDNEHSTDQNSEKPHAVQPHEPVSPLEDSERDGTRSTAAEGVSATSAARKSSVEDEKGDGGMEDVAL